MRLQDVSFSPPYVWFPAAKNDDPYWVQLNNRGVEACERCRADDYTPPKVKVRRPTLLGVGYGGYGRWLKAAAESANKPAWTHLICHTTITRLAEDATIDLRTIMGIANWKDPRLLDRYAAKSKARQRHAVSALDRTV